jgi:UDP-GlcNAc:undecaprenyl-phosphate/decaprenyl-phosphate GlcNAc-1-phosphate transferase
MRTFVAAFFIATVVAAVLTPFVRALAFRIGAVTAPGERHVHAHSTPRLGGVAIFFAFLAPLVSLFFVDTGVAVAVQAQPELVVGLLFGALAMCGLGFADDVRGIRALYKLLAQIAIAVCAYACGFRIEDITLPYLGTAQMGVFALPVTVVWIVGIVNAVNLIDGLDGLAGGVVFFAALTNFVVARISGNVFVAALMACMLGAVLGFLFFNFNPARIFMGDSGSYFLGFVLAASAISVGREQKASTTVSLLVPIIALGVPIFDTLFAIVRRFLERRPLFAPDRSHIHHRLVDLGMTQRRAVLVLYGVSITLAVAAIVVSLGRDWQVGFAILAASVIMIGLVRSVGAFHELHVKRRQKERIRTRHAELIRRLLPGLSLTFAAIRTRTDLTGLLSSFAREADLSYLEVLRVTGREEETLHRWQSRSEAGRHEGRLVSSRFPIPQDRGGLELKFGWWSETEEVCPQTEILLQVVADMVDGRLVWQPAEPAQPVGEEPRASSPEPADGAAKKCN